MKHPFTLAFKLLAQQGPMILFLHEFKNSQLIQSHQHSHGGSNQNYRENNNYKMIRMINSCFFKLTDHLKTLKIPITGFES